MKMIFAILHDEDVDACMRRLTEEGLGATRLCSSGGFLRVGNTTLLVGVDESKLELVLSIFKENTKTRTVEPDAERNGFFRNLGASREIRHGGVTMFVCNVEDMIKV